MFYTNRSIRLHSKALGYLELIQEANNRHEYKKLNLVNYDACKDWTKPIRLMNKREDIIGQIQRYQNLSDWLVSRYQSVMTELGKENLNRMKARIKEIDLINETNAH